VIIKKFQGKTENEAKAAAIKELGNTAVIMNVKTVKPKGFFAFLKPSIVELTAAVEEESDNPSPAKKPEAKPKAAPVFKDVIPDEVPAYKAETENDKIEQKLESLHSLIEERLTVDKKVEKEAPAPAKSQGKGSEMLRFFKLIYNTLLENEVDERYANDIIGELEHMNRAGTNIDQVLASLYQKMILKFGEANIVKKNVDGPQVVFFVGPTGVGKTTTIAKIASNFCVDEKKKVALVTTDTYRIAAADQLKVYANILESPFKIVYTAKEIQNAYAEFKDYDY